MEGQGVADLEGKDYNGGKGTLKSLLHDPESKASGANSNASETNTGAIAEHSQGLHGCIGFGYEKIPPGSSYTAGMGFYAAAWPLVDQQLTNFQIGLPSAWITPDNSDNKTTPLAPEGTLARKRPERGPTWSSVFQTVEGGLGYWEDNHFRYGPPKFSRNESPWPTRKFAPKPSCWNRSSG